MSESTAFKHHITEAGVRRLADHLAPHVAFDTEDFVRRAGAGLPPLELKARVHHVADTLASCLPPFVESAPRIERANASARDSDASLWVFWPLCSYIERHGTGHVDEALRVMRGLTHLASCEFAIRPFLAAEPTRVFPVLQEWAGDASWHVRRLASEGTRPLLPWGMRLKALQSDPSPSLPLLDRLFDDPSEDVRRSVANHINDISKDHPDLAVQVAAAWHEQGGEHTRAVIRHALRTLVKRGHVGALALQGFEPAELRTATLSAAPTTVQFGDPVTLRFEAVAQRAGAWMVDYAVHRMLANGKLKPKVFKWTRRTVEKGERVVLEKRHAIRPISTRRYYDGQHRCDVRVNGEVVAEAAFELVGVE
ncbi:MAG: DNA alkylation repair protein [Sandaracinaceae bacterium]